MKNDEITALKLNNMLAMTPFAGILGLEYVDGGDDTMTLRMANKPELERMPGSGQFHGGTVSSLVDTVGSVLVSSKIGAPSPTINFRIDYLRPSTGAHLDAVGTIRRLGGSVAVVDIDVVDDKGRLTAVARGTFGA